MACHGCSVGPVFVSAWWAASSWLDIGLRVCCILWHPGKDTFNPSSVASVSDPGICFSLPSSHFLLFCLSHKCPCIHIYVCIQTCWPCSFISLCVSPENAEIWHFQHSHCKTKCFFVNFLSSALVGAMVKLLLIRRDVATQCPRSILFPCVWETSPLLRGKALRVAISECTVETHKKENSTTHSGGERQRVSVLHYSLKHLDNGINICFSLLDASCITNTKFWHLHSKIRTLPYA